MERMVTAPPPREYEDFQPPSDWIREEGSNTFIVDLPGFKREQLRIQLDSAGILKITGECPLNGNKWRRFHKEVDVPENPNLEGIKAKFEDEMLYVMIPKTIFASEQDSSKQTSPTKLESPASQKTGKKLGDVSNLNDTHFDGKSGGGEKNTTADGKSVAGGGDGKKKSSTTVVGAEKQKSDSITTDVTNYEMYKKMKEREDHVEREGKMADGLRRQTDAAAGVGGIVKELDQSRQLIVNAIVAFLVVVALGIYVTYKFRSPNKKVEN